MEPTLVAPGAESPGIYDRCMDHYAGAFIAQPGRCWRMVTDPGPGRQGIPDFCKEPVVWRGQYRTPRGKWFVVESCEGHVDDELVGLRRISEDPAPRRK
jgi:hypothetical protein